jgi:hypothetical protein
MKFMFLAYGKVDVVYDLPINLRNSIKVAKEAKTMYRQTRIQNLWGFRNDISFRDYQDKSNGLYAAL